MTPAPDLKPSHFMRDSIAQVLMISGCAWCGAVLSQVFFQGEFTRFCVLVSCAPVAFSWYFGLGEPTRPRLRLQLKFTLVWLVLLFGCVGLATTDLVQFSQEGLWKRALAVLSFFGALAQLRRIFRELETLPSPAPNADAYLTTLPFPSLGDALASQAKVLGVAVEVLVERLEREIAAAAPRHFHSRRRFEAKHDPVLQTIKLAVVVAQGNGDEHLYDVAWQPEAQAQAKADDEVQASLVGFASVDCGFDRVVDRLTREVLGLPAQGPLDELRDDWLRLANAMLFSTRGQKRHLELIIEPNGLPAPIGRRSIIDITLEGPHLIDAQSRPRELDLELLIAGEPLHVGTVGWTEMPVSVLGKPDVAALEGWVKRWMAASTESDGSKWCGVVHKVELTQFTTGVELMVDFGSAPVSALEELVVLLRKSGRVSLDDAALGALKNRTHEGTRADILPLVRREPSSLSEHLVGELWMTWALESQRAFASMSQQDAMALGLGLDQLRSLALENLRKRIPPVRISGHSGVYMLTLPGEGGFLEASLLLLDEVWTEQLAPQLKGDPVVCIPFRDLVFVTGNDDEAGLAKLSELVADTRLQDLEHPLSTQVLVRREGQWRLRV